MGTDSCCVSYMNTGTLRASWTCGLKSAQTSCSMIDSEFKFWATIPSRVCPSTDSCCVSYYENGDAACKLDMWFEVSSNFMFHDCLVCSFLIECVQGFVMNVTRIRAT